MNKFDKIASTVSINFNEFNKPYKDDTQIYHYCTMDSFYEIIRSKKIRLGDLTTMNDPTELGLRNVHWANEIFNAYKKNYFEFNYTVNGMNCGMKEYLQLLSLQNTIFQNGRYNDLYFALCMSKKGDDLNQWRVYGDNGKGVCIGFKEDKIIEFKDNNPNFDYKDMEYIDIHLKKIVEKIAESILFKIKDLYENNKQDELLQFSYNIFPDIEQFILSYKDKTYEQESETRLIYKYHTDKVLVNNPIEKLLDDDIINLKTYKSHNIIKVAKELEIDKLGITSITLGPINYTPIQNLIIFLVQNGVVIDRKQIFHSEIPYRII